jgi:hypothetical protein
MKAFQCAHSGCLYPDDYIKKWGTKYGAGMGPDPVSMVCDTMYGVNPSIPGDTRNRRGNASIMHPAKMCRAQIDLVEVTAEDFKARRALLPGDPGIRAILTEKQQKNPRANVLVRKGKV